MKNSHRDLIAQLLQQNWEKFQEIAFQEFSQTCKDVVNEKFKVYGEKRLEEELDKLISEFAQKNIGDRIEKFYESIREQIDLRIEKKLKDEIDKHFKKKL